MATRYVAGQGTKRTKPRIGAIAAIVCVVIALGLDGLQFVFSLFHALNLLDPVTFGVSGAIGSAIAIVVPFFISILAFLGFGFFFFFSGVNYFSGKRAALKLIAAFGSLVIELVPLLDALPAITAGVVGIIIASRIEDAVGDVKTITHMTGSFARERDEKLAKAKTQEERTEIMREDRQRRASVAASVRRGTPVRPEDAPPESAEELATTVRGVKKVSPPEPMPFQDRGALYKPSDPTTAWRERLTRGKNMPPSSEGTDIPTEEEHPAA